MNSQTAPFYETYNEIIRECEVYLSITRDSALQIEAQARLTNLLEEVSKKKHDAIKKGDEDLANLLLGFECVCDCLINELKMWVLLKESKADSAWDALVASQMSASDAVRAHKGFSHVIQQLERLELIEELVFPPQVFMSSGTIVKFQQCSICGKEYGTCSHLVGKPYMGRFCGIICKDFTFDHVAIVKHPSDKRCRIINFEVDGMSRNRMTWKLEPIEHDKKADSKAGAVPCGGE